MQIQYKPSCVVQLPVSVQILAKEYRESNHDLPLVNTRLNTQGSERAKDKAG
jgi:hypothetical protein